jgi:hypothetical protein
MNIEYLTYLRDNPIKYPNDLEDQYPIKGIPLSEIEALETKYNNGNVFPKALRELLFLAGTVVMYWTMAIQTAKTNCKA